jgi:hypothetical protein
MPRLLPITIAIVITVAILGQPGEFAFAQTMVTTSTPLQANSESFFESSGIGWSVRRPGFFATFNNGGPIPPPFGGFNPNAGIQSGFQIHNGPWTGNLNFNFAQGSSRFSSTTAPVLTSLQGQPATFFSGTRRPFVLGLTPIVPGGGFGSQFSIPSGAAYHPGNGMSPVRQAIANGFRPTDLGRQKPDEKREPPRTATNADRSNSALAFFGVTPSGRQPASDEAAQNSTSPVARSQSEPVPEQPKRRAQIAPPQTLNEELADLYFRKGMKANSSGDLKNAEFYFRKSLGKASGARQRRAQKQLNAIRP